MLKTLTAIAKDNNIKYRQLRDKLVELNIILKERNKYVPTHLALEEAIAKESGWFGNEMVFSINYQYDEKKSWIITRIALS